MLRARLALVAALLVLAAGAGAALRSHAYLVQELGGSDLVDYDFPALTALRETLAHGRLPIWEPRMGCGYPLWAEGQVGGLFPTHWTVLAWPAPLAHAWTVLLNTWLAGLFAFLYARRLGCSPLAATLAALTYPLAGFFTRSVTNLSMLSGAALMPAALYYTDRYCAGEGRAAWIAAAFGLQCLAGHPQAPYYTALAVAGVALARTAPARAWGRLGAVAAAGVLGGLLAAARILPLAELLREGLRAGRLSFEQLSIGAPAPADLAQLLDPWASGDPSALTFDFGRMNGTFILFHVGVVGLVLATGWLAVSLPRDRDARLLAGLIAASALLAFGLKLGLAPLLGLVPGWGAFRFPGRALVVAELALALAAGKGLDALRAHAGAPVLHGLVIAQAVLLLSIRLPVWPTLPAHEVPGASAVSAQLLQSPPQRVLTLYRHRAWLATYVAAGGWRGDPAPYRRLMHLMTPNVNLLFGVSSATFYSPGEIKTKALLDDLLEPPDAARDGRIVALPPAFTRIAGLMGADHVLSAQPVASPDLEPILKSELHLYRNRAVRPRVALVAGVVPERDPLKDRHLLASPAFDLAGAVLLPGGTPRPAGPAGDASIVAEAPTALVIDVQATRDAHLVVADTWYPGWQATLDGAPATLHRANIAFRAVAVPAGTHRVVMRYDPPVFRAGAALTALAGLLAAYLSLRRPA